MVGILMSFRPVAPDDQLVVPVRLDVEVALAGEADDLHGQVVRDAVIENYLAIRQPHLRALVADDRAVKAEALHPGQGAGERPSRARGHIDAGGDDELQRRKVARIEVQPSVDDRAIEVEGKKPIARSDCYFLTSGLSKLGGRPPRTAVAMLRAAMADISDRVRTVALAMCGASTTLGIARRPGCTAGSRSYTSSPAPAIFLAFSASTRAASSTTGPRDVLIRIADLFICPNCGVLRM